MFEPSMDSEGYPLTGTQPLDARTIVATFDHLECAASGGAGCLPQATIVVRPCAVVVVLSLAGPVVIPLQWEAADELAAMPNFFCHGHPPS